MVTSASSTCTYSVKYGRRSEERSVRQMSCTLSIHCFIYIYYFYNFFFWRVQIGRCLLFGYCLGNATLVLTYFVIHVRAVGRVLKGK